MFSKFFIDRPIFATVVSIIIVIAGAMAIKGLPIEEYPKLTPPQISVSAVYTGADAQTISDSVASAIEDQINGVENMLYMQSTSSSSGSLNINVYFKIGTSAKQATIDVNNRVQAALSRLPQEVQNMGVTVRERSGSILEVIGFTSPKMNSVEMYNYVNLNIADEVKRVNGVGDTVLIGSKEYSMRIWLKPDLLAYYKLTPSDVIAQVKIQNSQYAAGKIGEQPSDGDNPYVYSVRTGGRLKNAAQFGDIIIKSADGATLKLKDVATVELGAASYANDAMLNGQDAIPLLIFMQNDANALATAQAVNAKLDELSKNFPAGFKHTIAYNPTEFIEVSIHEVVKTFIEAMILVIIVMYMFLKSFRATVIPMLAVPVSIIGTFGGLYAMGFSINLITLFALILAIGIVVDDAIIVIENVERILHEEKDITVKEATYKAMEEVQTPVISIVLVLSAVFVPVSFMEGFVGVIQRQFALTLVTSVCISGFVALTLTPALCGVMLKKQESKPFWFVQKFNDFFDWSTKIFTAGVAKVLRHVIISLILIGVMGFATFELFKKVPSGLVPSEDKGALMVITSLPPSSNMLKTKEEVKTISNMVLSNPNVEFTMGFAGYDMIAGALRENSAISFVKLKDWSQRKTPDSQADALTGPFNGMLWGSKESMSFVVNVPPIMGLSMTGGFEMYLQNKSGKSYSQIEEDVKKVVAAANARPDLTSVRSTLETNYRQFKIDVDRQKAQMFGVSESEIFSAIGSTFGSYYVNDFNLFGKSYRVYARGEDRFRNNPEDLRKIYVRSKGGEMIPLNSVATLTRILGPDIVDRFNLFPAAKIQGDPKPGYTSGDAIKAIQEVVEQTLNMEEYSISWAGTAYQEVSSQGTGSTAFIFGMIFVFLILAAQYERWLIPLAVITAVPFAVFGSLVAVWARGLTNDIYFQIGLLLLIGLSAKNAILIVEFAMQERLAGKSVFDAAVNAARLRFRPIVMTSLAFTLGVFPMVISTGAGAASRHSLGTGVIGGMIAATTIAIFFIPMFYYLLEKLNNKVWDKNQAEHRRSKMYKILTLAAALFLAGCSFRPEIPEVDTKFESTYKFETSDIRDEWWKEFGDENLNALVASALEKNTDLRTAYLNLQKAAANLGISEADLFPSVNLNVGYTKAKSSGETYTKQPQTRYRNSEVNLGLSYEIDLWGRVRNSVESAKASLNATKLDYATARLSISSSVAKSYFALVALNMREAVLKDTLKTYEETLALRKTQLDLGGINETTYLQSKAAVQSAKVSLLEVQTSLSQALTSVAVLTGKSNDEILKGAVQSAKMLPKEPEVSAGVSADILLRRSDVAKAYADLNATNALIGVAKADYLPSISLTGLFGFSSVDFENIFISNANTWSIGGSLVQKIFDYGRTKNNVRIAETNEQIAAVAYEAAIKKALGEVRDALNNRKNAKLTLNQVKELLHSQEKIYKLAKDQFEEGYTGHLELLDAQRNLLSVRLQDIAANLNLIDSVVDVYKAFGGGFKAE